MSVFADERRGIAICVGDAAHNSRRPDRRAVITLCDHGVALTQFHQSGTGATAAQREIAAAFLRGARDMTKFVRMNVNRLSLVPDLGARQAGDKQPRNQARQTLTISAKTRNSMAVKLSWSDGLTAP